MHPFNRCPRRYPLRTFAGLVAASAVLLCVSHSGHAQPPAKRPLTHQDYDNWRSIQQPLLSNDGKFAAYNLASGDGHSELIVRELRAGGAEYKYTRAHKAPTPPAGKGAAPAEGGIFGGGRTQFSADSKWLVFSISPPKAEPGKTAEKPSIGIMNLSNGKVTVIASVRSFALAEDLESGLIYHKSPATEPPPAEKKAVLEPDDEDWLLQQKKGGTKGGGDKKGTAQPAPKTASDLVIYDFRDGQEMVVPDVVDYLLTRDGKILSCHIAGKEPEDAGVFIIAGSQEKGKLFKLPLATGKGKYTRMTWDDDQRYLAFFVDRSASPKDPPALSLVYWDRVTIKEANPAAGPAGIELLDSKMTKGLKDGMVLSERGGINFSGDGARIFLGVAPPPPDK